MATTSPYADQDFKSVVESARQLYLEGKQTFYEANVHLSEPVYGRICSSRKGEPPAKLTANPNRKTAFIFGSDAIASIVLRNNAYDTLLRLGFTRDYLYYDVSKYVFPTAQHSIRPFYETDYCTEVLQLAFPLQAPRVSPRRFLGRPRNVGRSRSGAPCSVPGRPSRFCTSSRTAGGNELRVVRAGGWIQVPRK